jgi:hypothetical protein
MIWQLRIQSIIMVTRLFEDGKVRWTTRFASSIVVVFVQHKCIQYWPDEGEKRVNDFRIRLEAEEKYADYTIRRFALYNQAEVCPPFFPNDSHFQREEFDWPLPKLNKDSLIVLAHGNVKRQTLSFLIVAR